MKLTEIEEELKLSRYIRNVFIDQFGRSISFTDVYENRGVISISIDIIQLILDSRFYSYSGNDVRYLRFWIERCIDRGSRIKIKEDLEKITESLLAFSPDSFSISSPSYYEKYIEGTENYTRSIDVVFTGGMGIFGIENCYKAYTRFNIDEFIKKGNVIHVHQLIYEVKLKCYTGWLTSYVEDPIEFNHLDSSSLKKIIVEDIYKTISLFSDLDDKLNSRDLEKLYNTACQIMNSQNT